IGTFVKVDGNLTARVSPTIKRSKINTFRTRESCKIGRKSPQLVVLSHPHCPLPDGQGGDRRETGGVCLSYMLQLTDEALTSTQRQDYRSHPLATTDAVTVKMEYDADTESFVTYVKELHGVSTFGDT